MESGWPRNFPSDGGDGGGGGACGELSSAVGSEVPHTSPGVASCQCDDL